MPGARITAFRFLPGPVVAVTVRAPGELDPHGASLVVVDATTGRVVTVRDSRLRPWTYRLWADAKALHVGAVGGPIVRALYVLGGLASAALALSGYVLALARARAPVAA